MTNLLRHEHGCVECGKPHPCEFPECATLEGPQRLCSFCSWLYGWRQKNDQHDWSALND